MEPQNHFYLSQKFCYEPQRYPKLQRGEGVPRSTSVRRAGAGAGGAEEEEEEESPVVQISIVGDADAAVQDGDPRRGSGCVPE